MCKYFSLEMYLWLFINRNFQIPKEIAQLPTVYALKLLHYFSHTSAHCHLKFKNFRKLLYLIKTLGN